MAAPPLNLEVRDAGDGQLIATVVNASKQACVLPHAPVVGLRAVGDGGRWRSACKFDPVSSHTELAAGRRSQWRIGWAEALRRPDGPPPPGDYDVQVVFRLTAGGPVTISQRVVCAVGAGAPAER
jgi:hypothetical protein